MENIVNYQTVEYNVDDKTLQTVSFYSHRGFLQTGGVEFLLFQVVLLLFVGGFPVVFVGLIPREAFHEGVGVRVLDAVVHRLTGPGLVELGRTGNDVPNLHYLLSGRRCRVALDRLDQTAVSPGSDHWKFP